MRIGIEAQRLFRRKKHGMDIVALELIRNLEKIDKENDYFIFVKPGCDRCFKSSNRFRVIELYCEPYPLWEQVILPLAAAWYRCDLLHCTSSTAPIFCTVPRILTLHDIFFLEQISFGRVPFSLYQRLGKWYRKVVVPRVVMKCMKVITVSESERKRIDSFFRLRDENFFVISNGVSEQFRKIDDPEYLDSIRREFNLPPEFIFFLGNTDPKKNTKGVFLAYQQYLKKYGTGLPLVVADISVSNFRKILKAIDATEIAPHTLILDYVPNTSLPALYNLSKVFLYPSLRESFGIPILEAQACGTPVITSKIFSMPEVAGEAAYFVDPKDTGELADSIHRMLSDNELRVSMIRKGLVHSKKYSWESMARKIHDIYMKLKPD
jgi:glycosyltransferase involved in cell wall biosynthesis